MSSSIPQEELLSSTPNTERKWTINPLMFASGNRKSAFLPYKPTNTVLTNLQRGNTEANFSNSEIYLSFHEKSGQGEITADDINRENHVDILDVHNYTPLHWACYYGQISAAALLVDHGADVNKVAPDYITPLLLAACGGHNEIVRILLQKGADVDYADIAGNTALMYAAAGNHPHTSHEILGFNPCITHENEDGETAYTLAVRNNSNLAQAVIENYLVSLLTS